MASLKSLLEINDMNINQLIASFIENRTPTDAPICCFYSGNTQFGAYFKCDSEEGFEHDFIFNCKKCQEGMIDRLKKAGYLS
ncbi:hypothetical protein HZA33_00325 [Candidatus Pacearchaeota archaeon]|nr:hypothetical protein [Candidatus Pacearchaeota archaeon]